MPNRILIAIMLGILLWGSVHAYGAYTFNHNPWRAVVMIGFTVGFLEFWLMMILFRAWRQKRKLEQDQATADPEPHASK